MENIGKARFEATANLVRSHVGKNSKVVEIGSNDGSFRDGFPGVDWTTIDKFGDPDIRVDLDSYATELPFENRSIDLIICTEVLEHLTCGSALVAEFGRILKVSGTVVVSVPNVCSLKSRMKVAFGRLPNLAASGDAGHPLGGTGVLMDGRWVAGHVMDFNLARLRGYLLRGGLTINAVVSVPIEFSIAGQRWPIPSWVMPATFCDFLLVSAGPERV